MFVNLIGADAATSAHEPPTDQDGGGRGDADANEPEPVGWSEGRTGPPEVRGIHRCVPFFDILH